MLFYKWLKVSGFGGLNNYLILIVSFFFEGLNNYLILIVSFILCFYFYTYDNNYLLKLNNLHQIARPWIYLWFKHRPKEASIFSIHDVLNVIISSR
jgi:hypothetical protein